MKVLFSHSLAESEGPTASRLRAIAAVHGFSLVLPEREHAARTAPQIADVDAVIALVSQGGRHNDWVKWELAAAQKFDRPRVAIVEAGLPVPPGVSPEDVVRVDRSKPDSFEQAVAAVARHLKKEVPSDQAQAITAILILIIGFMLLAAFASKSGKPAAGG